MEKSKGKSRVLKSRGKRQITKDKNKEIFSK
jgi:hypothetical protein